MGGSEEKDLKSAGTGGSGIYDKQNNENTDSQVPHAPDLADIRVMEKEMYRNIYTRNYVVDFYAKVAGSREIAEIMLMYADNFNLPYTTVFALVWTESRFRVKAVSYNDNSVDRGLFQLNSRSFPHLKENEFFNLETNVMYGIKHLKWCLDSAEENYIVALAMYNAGKTRVEKNGTPMMTLDYISRILSKQQELEAGFRQILAVCYSNREIELLIN